MNNNAQGYNGPPRNQVYEPDEQTAVKLRQKFQSKKALWWFLVNKAVSTQLLRLTHFFLHLQNVFLPDEKNCPIGFLHQILAGNKYVFWNYQVTTMRVPQWPEFSIANMWDQCRDIPEVKIYCPDTWSTSGHRKPEKKFLFALITTMYSEWFRDAVADCSQQRHGGKEAAMYEPRQVQLTQFWAKELLNIPYISRKYSRDQVRHAIEYLYPNHFASLIIEFGGKNQGVLKSVPEPKKVPRAPQQEEEKKEPAEKKVYTIAVSLKQWLIQKKQDSSYAPFLVQAP